ncbi:ABC transporter permease [Pusillimonas caeni]|uniref:ABC transporter permease n=1 Tax=Pusillimonas caeni TaxID=1348472 RepID=UPI00142F83EA|nr:ABC transporter permease [Pusillimonas caeni]
MNYRSIAAKNVKPLIGLALILAVWQVWAGVLHPGSIVLPAPSAIASYCFSHTEVIFYEGWQTLKVVLAGFGIALALAMVVAIVFALIPALRDMFLPLFVVTQVTPTIAVAPLLVIALGFGSPPKIAVVVLIATFPILVSTLAGIDEVPKDLLDITRASGASRWRAMRYVALPNSAPYFFSGARVAITLSVIGAVVGEFVATDSGLGYLILQGSSRTQPDVMWAGVLSLAILGLALFNAVRLIEWAVMPWKRA